MRKLKSIARLSLLSFIAWLQGFEMIVWQSAEVEFVEAEAIPYSDLDREQLEQMYTIEED